MFDSFSEDDAREEFFAAIPGFLESKVHKEHLSNDFRNNFSQDLGGFLDHTFSSSLVAESVRSDRLIICLDASRAALGSEGVSHILQDILSGRWPEMLQSIEMGHSLRRWRNSNDECFTPNVRRIVAQIVVGVRERDKRWLSLVKAEYSIAGHVLRQYIDHGDSVLLFILIQMTRQAFHTRSWTPWILSSLSEFNIRDTSPELQHTFCALWNYIVLEAWNEEGFINIPVQVLREVRHVYIALHEGTDAAQTASSTSTYHFHPNLDQPRSYRPCAIASHRRNLSINTSVTGSINVPSVTQLNQSPVASPIHSSRSHDSGISSQGEEEIL